MYNCEKVISFDDINMEEYSKQLEYFNNYYGSPFRKEQGTEEILDVINKYSKDGTLIDFGSGSNIYFWLTAFKNIQNVLCVDISKEAFYINEQIRKKELYPQSCEYALNKYNKDFDNVLKTNVNYLIYDILKFSVDMTLKFDNVTQFGLLGLCKNEKEYTSNLKKLYSLVNNDGVLIGANWCFSESYSDKMGFNNKYLSEQLINSFAKVNNYTVLFNKLIPIKNDRNYKSVLVYVLKK